MIGIKAVASGKEYRLDTLAPGQLQYMDRLYEFSYVPEQLRGCTAASIFCTAFCLKIHLKNWRIMLSCRTKRPAYIEPV